jgi:hypothetical protein
VRRDSAQNRAKRAAAEEWVKAINLDGGFGQWRAEVAYTPSDVNDMLEAYSLCEHSENEKS